MNKMQTHQPIHFTLNMHVDGWIDQVVGAAFALGAFCLYVCSSTQSAGLNMHP